MKLQDCEVLYLPLAVVACLWNCNCSRFCFLFWGSGKKGRLEGKEKTPILEFDLCEHMLLNICVFLKATTLDFLPFGRPVEENVQSLEKCWP